MHGDFLKGNITVGSKELRNTKYQTVTAEIHRKVKAKTGALSKEFKSMLVEDESLRKKYIGIPRYIAAKEFYDQNAEEHLGKLKKWKRVLLRRRYKYGWSIAKIKKRMQEEAPDKDHSFTAQKIQAAMWDLRRKADAQFRLFSSLVSQDSDELNRLNPRTREMIEAYAELSGPFVSASEIGDRFDLTASVVLKIFKRAEVALRKAVAARYNITIEEKDRLYYHKHKPYLKYITPFRREILTIIFEERVRRPKKIRELIEARGNVPGYEPSEASIYIERAFNELREVAKRGTVSHMIESRRVKDPDALENALIEVFPAHWSGEWSLHPAWVVLLMYPPGQDYAMSYAEVAEEFGDVTVERIRQLRNRAIFRLADYWGYDLDEPPQEPHLWQPALAEALEETYKELYGSRGLFLEDLTTRMNQKLEGRNFRIEDTRDLLRAFLPNHIKAVKDPDYQTALRDLWYRIEDAEASLKSKVNKVSYRTVAEVLWQHYQDNNELLDRRSLIKQTRVRASLAGLGALLPRAIAFLEQDQTKFKGQFAAAIRDYSPYAKYLSRTEARTEEKPKAEQMRFFTHEYISILALRGEETESGLAIHRTLQQRKPKGIQANKEVIFTLAIEAMDYLKQIENIAPKERKYLSRRKDIAAILLDLQFGEQDSDFDVQAYVEQIRNEIDPGAQLPIIFVGDTTKQVQKNSFEKR